MDKKTKIYLGLLVVMYLLTGLGGTVDAGTVVTQPTLINAHIKGFQQGEVSSNTELFSKIVYQNGQLTQTHSVVVPYDLGDASIDPVDYVITFNPPFPYTFTTSGDCSGTVGLNETKTCEVTFEDNATKKVAENPFLTQLAPTPAPQPIQPVQQVTVDTPDTELQAQITNLEMIISLLKQIIALKLQILALEVK